MLKNKLTYQYLQLISLLLLPWGLFFFEAMPSILVICFAIPLLIFGSTLQIQNAVHRTWPFLLIYGILIVSGFWSREGSQWLNLLRVNLPYLVLPLAFLLWPEFLWSRRQLFQRQFIWAGASLSVYVLIYSMIHMSAVLVAIREGGSFPVPVSHVQSGLFLALAGVFAWDELSRWKNKLPPERRITAGLLILVILGIHLLAVRAGLILFYTGTILTFILNKNFHTKWGIKWAISLLGMAVLAGLLLPTLYEKWSYFLEDIRNYNSASWWFYSDALRWRTNEAGLAIFRDAPWWGVGMGDLFQEIHMWFYENKNVRIWEYPHNLWITFLAGSGIVGFLLLNLSLGKLILQLWRKSSTVYWIVISIFMISCLVENTLLTSLGSISFVMLMLMAIENDGATEDDVLNPAQN